MKQNATLPPTPLTYRMTQAVMWPFLKVFGLSCRHAFELSSAQMDRKLTNREALQLRIHLAMCGLCRRLPAQFRGMRSLIQACQHDHSKEETSHESLPPNAKERIAKSLKSHQE